MKISFFLGFTSLWMILVTIETRSAERHSESKILRNYSLQQLDSAANLLVRAADQSQGRPKALYCRISSNEAHQLLQALHALMDQKINQLLNSTSLFHPVSRQGWLKNCRRTCHCGLYASILEKIEESRLTSIDQKALTFFQDQALKISPSEMNTCIQKALWFCRSSLLDYLRDS